MFKHISCTVPLLVAFFAGCVVPLDETAAPTLVPPDDPYGDYIQFAPGDDVDTADTADTGQLPHVVVEGPIF